MISFHKNNLVKRVKSLSQLNKAQVSFYEMEAKDSKYHNAEVIEVISQPEKDTLNNDLVGKIIDGTVKNLAEFGIFVRLPKLCDGLIHKNNLPKKLKETFKDEFNSGDIIKVRIYKVTEKGLQLKLEVNE